jgi:transketolase
MGAYGGVSDSFDGPTHHAITDIAILRSLPGMTILVPTDTTAVAKLLPQVVAWPGPVYMRLNRNEVPLIHEDDYAPQIGQAIVLRPGSDVTLVGTGLMVSRCLEAAEVLAGEGMEARVIETHTIKPFDNETIVTAARETGALVTAEEHSIIGGLGGAVIEALAGPWPVPVERVGIADRFGTTGPYDDLLALLGLAVSDIVAAAHRAIGSKRG